MNEWEELDIDNFPHDFAVMDAKFEYKSKNKDIWFKINDMNEDRIRLKTLLLLQEGFKIRYRRKPKKKTVEEMAKIWFYEYEDTMQYEYEPVKDSVIAGFVAGYKAKESELNG